MMILLLIKIYNPNQWKNIDTNLRHLFVKQGSIKIYDIDFPKDIHYRHFSSSYYIQRPNFLYNKKFKRPHLSLF